MIDIKTRVEVPLTRSERLFSTKDEIVMFIRASLSSSSVTVKFSGLSWARSLLLKRILLNAERANMVDPVTSHMMVFHYCFLGSTDPSPNIGFLYLTFAVQLR